jgi:glycerol-3-phosphate O-acyltransferase
MTSTVTLPLWAVVLLVALAALAALDRLLVPSVRWFLRRRVNRALEEFNSRLQIRLQPFKLTKRRVLIDRLMFDAKVQEAAEKMAVEEEMPRQVVMERVERYAREIVPSFNAYLYFRIGYWISRRVARSLYRVRLGAVDETGLQAIPPNATVVFIINHRSNFDYILVSYLVAERTALSYAVGEWARIWPLETLIRSMGAYFVRRRSRNDLYRRVLASYVAMATREGVTQAVFPEGGLSRDGRLRPPKLGLLDYMLRSYDPEGERDLIFVPVGINYDRVLEDRTLLLDLDDEATRPGRMAALGKTVGFISHQLGLMLTGRWHRFGYASVNIGTPISIQSYLKERNLDLRALPREERFANVAALGNDLIERLGALVPALPVSLVATVLVREPDRCLTELELKTEVQGLIDELEAAGILVYVPRHDREYAIEVGVRGLTLRRILESKDGLYRVVPEELPVLRYYANALASGAGTQAGVASAP